MIVTARKREETLLDIPQEIQAISQEQLQKANLNCVEDFVALRAEPHLQRHDAGPRHDLLPRRRRRLLVVHRRRLRRDLPRRAAADAERAAARDPPRRHRAHRGAARTAGHALRLELAVRDAALHHEQAGRDAASSRTSASTPTPSTTATRATRSPASSTCRSARTSAIRVVGFSARDAGFIDNVLGESLGGTFDNAEFVEQGHQQRRVRRRTRSAALDAERELDRRCGRRLPDRWTPTPTPRTTSYRSGREYAVVRFHDESRSDEWTQLALTLQGDLGWGQLTSATSYFTRRHLLLPGQHRLHVLPLQRDATPRIIPRYDLRPGPGRPRLERSRLRGPIRAGIPACRARRRR